LSSLLLELDSVSLEVGGSSTELLLDTNCFSELLEDNLSPWRFEELIGSTKLLLDFAELLLDLAFELDELFTTEEELLDLTEFDDTLVSFSSFDEEDFAELLLDPIASLQDDDKGLTLDEDFAFSLLDELFWMPELEDFAELLLDSGSLPGMTGDDDFPCSTEEDDSIPNSSFGPEEDESSPQATNIIAAETIATRNFFISPPTNPK
jgi:hypothetical protein